MKNEKNFQLFVFALGLVVMFSGIRTTFRPNFVYFVIGMACFFLLLGCFFVTLVLGFTKRKYFIYRWMFLPLFCLLFMASVRVTPSLGLMIRDLEFKERFEDYDSVVKDIKDGKIPCANTFSEIDPVLITRLPSTVIDIRACRCSDGDVVVMFITSNGGRIHNGLVFSDLSNKGDCTCEIPKRISLNPIENNWYRFSD